MADDGLSAVARWRNRLRDSAIDPTAKLVGYVLSTYMHSDANGAWPSKRTLADGCGLNSVRAVDAAINRLEETGLLEVRRSVGRNPNVYRGIVPDQPDPAADRHERADPFAYLDRLT